MDTMIKKLSNIQNESNDNKNNNLLFNNSLGNKKDIIPKGAKKVVNKFLKKHNISNISYVEDEINNIQANEKAYEVELRNSKLFESKFLDENRFLIDFNYLKNAIQKEKKDNNFEYKKELDNLFNQIDKTIDLKDAIGKDLNRFAMPVFLNEPLSMLQKLCENFQYADLLNRAAEETNPHLRLAYVACFNIAGLTMNIHRAKKLFNPILFETYEYIDNNLNYRFFAEQVSHHPAISAFFAEGKGWNIYSNNNSKVKLKFCKFL